MREGSLLPPSITDLRCLCSGHKPDKNITFVKAWSQTNGDHSLVGDFVLNSEARSVSGDDCQVQ